jgi:hypothetical protein
MIAISTTWLTPFFGDDFLGVSLLGKDGSGTPVPHMWEGKRRALHGVVFMRLSMSRGFVMGGGLARKICGRGGRLFGNAASEEKMAAVPEWGLPLGDSGAPWGDGALWVCRARRSNPWVATPVGGASGMLIDPVL